MDEGGSVVVVGQGGVRRKVDWKDRRRTKWYEVVVDIGRGEKGVGQME